MKKGSEMSTTTTTEPEVQAPPEITTNPVSQTLWDAADLLERDGWCQGGYSDNEGRHCLIGAIKTVNPGDDHGVTALDLIVRFLNQNPVCWNDVHDRTRDEVISVLRQASEAPAHALS
jgi:hypothetical protein